MEAFIEIYAMICVLFVIISGKNILLPRKKESADEHH